MGSWTCFVPLNQSLLSSGDKHLVSAAGAHHHGRIPGDACRGRAPTDSLTLPDVPHHHAVGEREAVSSFSTLLKNKSLKNKGKTKPIFLQSVPSRMQQ